MPEIDTSGVSTPDPSARRGLEGEQDDQDRCAICGELGADKIPHPCHWPGEFAPSPGEYVHQECEREECGRAHREFYGRAGDKGVREFLRQIQ